MSECIFCGIVAGEIPADIVDEAEQTVAFRDIAPQAPVHVLVVPRVHIDHAGTLSSEHAAELSAMLEAAQRVAVQEGIAATDRGYRLVFNVGKDAQNSVSHLHLHVIGGRPMSWPPG